MRQHRSCPSRAAAAVMTRSWPLGRLFWKLFSAFIGALAVVALLVTLVFGLIGPREGGRFRPASVLMADTVAELLQQRGPDAATGLLQVWQARGERLPWVIAADGRELLGRRPPAERPTGLRIVDPQGVEWRVIEARPLPPPGGTHLPPPPFVEVVAVLIGAMAFSALLAWYLSRPVRHLHRAFDALATGNLDVRIAPLIGRRRDEIADLGRGFDRMAEQIQHLLDAQRRLLHDVSHELRSPLARMTAAIGLARQDRTRIDAMLERVEREVGRLDALVGELLGLSRMEYDSGRALPQPVCLDALLREVVEDARFEASTRGIRVDLVSVPATVTGHVELLRRAVDNVLRNAVKYAPPASSVEVDMVLDGARIRIAVSDRGCGVAEEELERIFDPFFRGVRDGGSSGAGLGLSIARRAVMAHGGSIRAINRDRGGLRIDIVLPTEDPVSLPA